MLDMFPEANILGCRTVDTPMNSNSKLQPDQGPFGKSGMIQETLKAKLSDTNLAKYNILSEC